MSDPQGQLTLNIQLRDEALFENYWVSEDNRLTLKALHHFLAGGSQERVFYLWGLSGVGKTHLALAASQGAISAHGDPVGRYLPLSEYQTWGTEMLESLHDVQLWCLDDVDWVAGDGAWEEGLFHFYNQIMAQPGARLLLTASQPPAHPGWQLPDLKSRFSHAWIFQLHGLTDADKIQALILHAKMRGLVLPISVGQYLLHHGPRDMRSLFELLDQMDEASLSAKRNWTIPFVKDVLKKKI